MRREELFSRSGFYGFLLKINVLLHREATHDAIEAARPVLARWEKNQPIAVLDLACGGWPLAIADVIAAFPDRTFHYTGVDINPDQIALAESTFPFPANVTVKRLLEGNAWQLDELDLEPAYTLIFSGMNLHHGTPAEVAYLGRQVQHRLLPGGRFISHDVYRPDEAPYFPRPMIIDGESAALVDPVCLASTSLPVIQVVQQREANEPDWRRDYLERMRRTLLEQGADSEGADSTVRHMRSRDYPISTRELRSIMVQLGFEVQTQRYDLTSEPLGPYIATCIMSQPESA